MFAVSEEGINRLTAIFRQSRKVEPTGSMDEITVETRAGKVRGKKDNSESVGLEFFSFKGIPYARPPLGKLRFRVSSLTSTEKMRVFLALGLVFLLSYRKMKHF